MKRSCQKKEKKYKKESPMKTDPDEMCDLFCSGEGRGERE